MPNLIEAVRLEAWNTTGIGTSTYSPEVWERLSSDNGRTWEVREPVYTEDLADMAGEHQFPPHYYTDPDNGLVLGLSIRFNFDRGTMHQETFSDAGCYSKTFRIFYRLSRDQGHTWTPAQQVIHSGQEYDEQHWGPGLHYGENGGMPGVGPVLKLRDGTVLQSVVVNLWDGKRYQSGFLRGRWRADLSGLDWEFGEYLSLPLTKSTQGCCEPAPALLDDGRIFVSLRAAGDREKRTFPSLKFWVLSEDGGRTFSDPKPLTYEDESLVWSPSSFAGIVHSSPNGRYYWIGNILDEPTYTSYPRYPLCIAELIPDRGVLVRSSVTVVDTQPEDWAQHPEDRRGRRYTNFGFYEDRETKEIVLTLPEQPKVSWDDFTADCYRYRIDVGA